MKKWLIAICILLFALSLRLWNLNMMGRWWDEGWYVEKGYHFIQDIKMGNFSDPFWYTDGTDHPPLSSYFYGIASYNNFIRYDPNTINNFPSWPKGSPIFHYDLTSPRLVSVFVSCLAILLVFFMATSYFSLFVGIVSAVILAMLPHFLGFSQLVDLESWIMLFFTACVYSYLLYLETRKRSFLLLTGILTGLSLAVKQSDILIFFFYLGVFFIWKKMSKNKTVSFSHLLPIILLSMLTFFLVCPIPWFHPKEFLQYTYQLWFQNEGLIPELIFGKSMGAHFFYYILAFLITTPIIVLLLTGVGLFVAKKQKNWHSSAVIIWFLVPFLMTFFHERQNMVRYVIEVYAPLSILAAIGLEFVMHKFSKNAVVTYAGLIFVGGYLFLILLQITPYYLDYYNELVGGTKNVYEKQLFFIGWFGEGLRGPGLYIAIHAHPHSRIGMALDPVQTLYTVPTLHYELFDSQKKYDYVVVNAFNITRMGFKENILLKKYRLVYTEKAGGADIAHVYKHI